MKKITIKEFEAKVLEREEIAIVVRAPAGELVWDYDFERKAAGTSSITDWIESRIRGRVAPYEFDVVTGNYVVSTPHGRTKLETLRAQYEK